MKRNKLEDKKKAFIEGADLPVEKTATPKKSVTAQKPPVKTERRDWSQKEDIKKAVTMNLYARLFQEFKQEVLLREEGRSASEIVNNFIMDYLGKK